MVLKYKLYLLVGIFWLLTGVFDYVVTCLAFSTLPDFFELEMGWFVKLCFENNCFPIYMFILPFLFILCILYFSNNKSEISFLDVEIYVSVFIVSLFHFLGGLSWFVFAHL